MRSVWKVAGILMVLAVPISADAQGVVGGASQGASQGAKAGNKAAGPVGGAVGTVVGGTAGAVTGGVQGVLGVTPKPKAKKKKSS